MTIKPRSIYIFPNLKIKQTSLGAEAKLIRKEELKYRNAFRKARMKSFLKTGADVEDRTLDYIRQDLYHHRITVVKRECRAANIVIAFLKGKPFEHVERKTYIHEILGYFMPDLVRIATKYGNENDQEKVKNALYNWIYAHPDLQSKRPNWLKA